MRAFLSHAIFLSILIGFHHVSGQGIQLTKTLNISESPFRPNVDFSALKKEINSPNDDLRPWLLKADRGDKKGQNLLVLNYDFSQSERHPSFSRFVGTYLDNYSNTKYELIGPEKTGALGKAGILGFHYIKVLEIRSNDFEKFVVSKLHPAVANLLPDMKLLYFKAVEGTRKGSYLLVFAITSTAARDKYWPEGSETQLLKDAFTPLKGLAQELLPYLEPGSYLEIESGGAAAIFESKEWTDFVVVE